MFIDNGVLHDEDVEDLELGHFIFAIDRLLEFTYDTKPFYCKDFKAVMKHNDQHKKDLMDLQAN